MLKLELMVDALPSNLNRDIVNGLVPTKGSNGHPFFKIFLQLFDLVRKVKEEFELVQGGTLALLALEVKNELLLRIAAHER